MALNIETFNNQTGQNGFYKAVSHPLATEAATRLLNDLKSWKRVAVYDPMGCTEDFFEFYSPEGISFVDVYVQTIEKVGTTVLGHTAQPVTELPSTDAGVVFVMAFDAERLVQDIRHLLPNPVEVITLDTLRLPPAMLVNKNNYTHPTNFATNFAFFRDTADSHTRLITVNYWARYGAKNVRLWLQLFDKNGKVLKQWIEEPIACDEAIVIDSQEIRERFSLKEFTGQLFIHALGIAGHDTVKYALDIYGDIGNALSCTHDANAWPADFYAGLPAPRANENVVLWVQNSHPNTIPAGEIGFKIMGTDKYSLLDTEVRPFATLPVSINQILPDAFWPQQIEVLAGKHFIRPRYEITSIGGDTRIAHVNVERTDLKSDHQISGISELMGKGYILPAPILPAETWNSLALPTPMTTSQDNLPIALLAHDPEGQEILRLPLGKLPRNHARCVDLSRETQIKDLLGGQFGHMELVYDFSSGGDSDGWLHSLFRFENRATGNVAETSFGAHIFNTVLTYGTEPQSYSGRAPGLTTRLFLRVGTEPLETICHLIYPSSTPWHSQSKTDIKLFNGEGEEIARERIEIPCGGSRFWKQSELFDAQTRKTAGKKSYVIVRDTTCRLFGYHGLVHPDGGFSLDHMFGF